ncbi:MAG: Maf family protein [Ilumatobacteraceae bacterium]
MRIVLGSASPRRRDLLAQLGLDLDIRPADIDETEHPGEDPVSYVRRLSIEKADAVQAHPDELVVAADTTVDLDGRILAKPADDDEVRAMLRSLSDRTHRVHTGVTLRLGDATATEVATTFVTFAPVTATAIEWYLATGEPFGKAGAYAIQGAGGVFVASVQGSVSNVVGLPLTTVVSLARQLGVELV